MQIFPRSRKTIGWGPALLVFALAGLSSAWTLKLYFQVDDFWIIPEAPRLMSGLGELVTDAGRLTSGGEPVLRPTEHPHFQPTLWAMLHVENSLAGVPAKAWVYHLLSVLMHGFASILLLKVLHQWFPLGVSAAAAGWFAVHPAGIQAVSWISARSHVLGLIFVLLTLLCMMRAHRVRSSRWAVAAGLSATLAFASHTEVLFALFILAVAFILDPPPSADSPVAEEKDDRLWDSALALSALVLPFFLGWVVRARFLGIWGLSYKGQLQLGPAIIPEVLKRLHELVLQVLFPWNQDQSQEALAPLWPDGVPGYVLGAFIWCAILGAGWAGANKLGRRRLLQTVAVLCFITAPAAVGWTLNMVNQDLRESRSLYLVAAGLAAVLAAALSGASRSSGPLSIARVAFVLLLFLSTDALVHTAKIEKHAASQVLTRREILIDAGKEVTTHLVENGKAVAHHGLVLVEDPFVLMAGVPLIGPHLLPRMMRPPFTTPAVRVHAEGTLSQILGSHRALNEPELVRVLAWEVNRLQQRGELLARLEDSPLPKLVREDNRRAKTWKAIRYVPNPKSFTPRRVRALRIPNLTGEGRELEVALWWTAKESLVFKLTLTEGDTEAVVILDEHPTWVLADEVKEVFVRGSAVTPDSCPEFLPDPGSLPPLGPIAKNGIKPRIRVGEVPVFHIGKVPEGSRIQLEFRALMEEAVYHFHYVAPASSLFFDGTGGATYRPEAAHFKNHDFITLLAFHTLPFVFDEHLLPFGVSEVETEWRALVLYPESEALPSGEIIRARTRWVPMIVGTH